MIANVDLHLRIFSTDAHRNLGVVAVECDGQVMPHQEIACRTSGRQLRAHVTSVRCRRDRILHVYADAKAD